MISVINIIKALRIQVNRVTRYFGKELDNAIITL